MITAVKPYRTDSLMSELASIGSELCGKRGWILTLSFPRR